MNLKELINIKITEFYQETEKIEFIQEKIQCMLDEYISKFCGEKYIKYWKKIDNLTFHTPLIVHSSINNLQLSIEKYLSNVDDPNKQIDFYNELDIWLNDVFYKAIEYDFKLRPDKELRYLLSKFTPLLQINVEKYQALSKLSNDEQDILISKLIYKIHEELEQLHQNKNLYAFYEIIEKLQSESLENKLLLNLIYDEHDQEAILKSVLGSQDKIERYYDHQNKKFAYNNLLVNGVDLKKYGSEAIRIDQYHVYRNLHNYENLKYLKIHNGLLYNQDASNALNLIDNVYILDKHGRIYTEYQYKDTEGRTINAHSFLKTYKDITGKYVACAGYIKIENGKIIYIDNGSGHYKPNFDQLKLACKYLMDCKVLSSECTVQVYDNTPLIQIFNLSDILFNIDVQQILVQYPKYQNHKIEQSDQCCDISHLLLDENLIQPHLDVPLISECNTYFE